MLYLKREDIYLINKMTVEQHGGQYLMPHNILNENPLAYLLEMVESEMFGEALYPKISDKAGFYAFSIIANHVFQDGNKRTGLGAALLFLKMNGYRLKSKLIRVSSNDKEIPNKGSNSREILYEFIIELASGKFSLEESQQWFCENIEKR